MTEPQHPTRWPQALARFVGKHAILLGLAALTAWLSGFGPHIDPFWPAAGYTRASLNVFAMTSAAGYLTGLLLYTAVVAAHRRHRARRPRSADRV